MFLNIKNSNEPKKNHTAKLAFVLEINPLQVSDDVTDE